MRGLLLPRACRRYFKNSSVRLRVVPNGAPLPLVDGPPPLASTSTAPPYEGLPRTAAMLPRASPARHPHALLVSGALQRGV